MSKPKVLMVSCEGLGNGGVQAVMMSIVRNLKDKFIFDMLLFTSEKRFYDEEFLSYNGKIIRIPFYEGNNKFRKRIDYCIRGISLYKKIKSAIKENGPYEVIHCNNVFESALCILAAKKNGVPVRIVHSHVSPMQPIRLAIFLNKIYQKIILKNATALVGCSKEACSFLFGNKTSSEVIFNPYNEKKYEKKSNTDVLKVNSLVLTQVGRFDDNKNQLFTIDILNELKQKKKNVHLNFVGFGSEATIALLKNKIQKMNLESNVIFFDGDSDIPSILSKSDAFVLTSKREGFGIVLIEAQAMGLRCFVSNSVPKTTNVGGCIYLPLDGGAKIWADAILNSDLQKKDYDCTEFTIENFVKKINHLYRSSL